MQAASAEKLNGRFYTLEFIVDNVLDLASYHGQTILKKHVIDNSCGDGAFLIAAVTRYCKEFLKHNSDRQILSQELSYYIHGIEIDKTACRMCLERLNCVVQNYGIEYVDWDITCADTLTVEKYNGKMDYVVGNPPYVRIHNLENACTVKNFSFTKTGMTDLYIAFFEIGLNMLNDNGTLGYITPSSYFNSLAGKRLRSYFVQHNLLDKIVDLKHFQAFSATTYTAITILKKNRSKKTTDYFQFENRNNFPYFVDTLYAKDYYIKDSFYFSKKKDLEKLIALLQFVPEKEHFSVKNGFATLADNFFIGDFDFNDFTIPVIKASTGKRSKCLFPYANGKLIPYQDLTDKSCIRNYFESHKDMLLRRSLDRNSVWYGFGRSQGIKDVYRCKYAINTLLRTPSDLKLIKCDKGVGVYSGLYIMTDIEENELREILYNEDFITYISLLGKYKSGGYYTFSSKDLKIYLEYSYTQRKKSNYEQLTISDGS